ncbi:hypothetical protein MDA_GLEAN10008405 [Myotis davidii]|uniref:Uncharacterized protein n=1 Tax=Myotis davidii TaxID=225400 RepID=L5LLY5_MYODS|nr:hypothetical protein MDA_GLEAN10008405 [Myotis davidii]
MQVRGGARHLSTEASLVRELWCPGGVLGPHLRGPACTHLGLALPAHLLYHPAAVPLWSGIVGAGSTSTAAHCQCHVTNARYVLHHSLVLLGVSHFSQEERPFQFGGIRPNEGLLAAAFPHLLSVLPTPVTS